MHALHHHDNDAGLLVIEPGEQRVGEPLVDLIPQRLGLGIHRLLRVIDDEDIATESRQSGAHGRCAPITALRGEYLGICRPRDLHPWECALVPGRLDQRAKVARVPCFLA